MRRLRMRQGIRFAVLVSIAIAAISQGDEPSTKKANKPRNRLAKETSPYLLQHASNPVDWFAWGPEAFAKAKKEGKLVFLSIGYSSCHWCHVMERESFENGEVAKRLNDWFVSIKVDREERPDIDAVYMTALNVLGNRGGWPLSMFLTADGKPIVGGTYWPPEDRAIAGDTIPGFKSVLKTMHEWQTTKADRLQAQADRVATATRAALTDLAGRTALVDLDRKLVQSTQGKSTSPRAQSLSSSTRAQSRRLVSVGRGSLRQGQEGGQAGFPVHRLQLVSLVSRDGARIV